MYIYKTDPRVRANFDNRDIWIIFVAGQYLIINAKYQGTKSNGVGEKYFFLYKQLLCMARANFESRGIIWTIFVEDN